MTELPDGTEIHVPRFVGILLFVAPIVAVGWAWLASGSPGADPTGDFFKGLLNANPAANPVAYHAPFRDDGSLVYISSQETEVRAAMNGVISNVGEHSVELLAKNTDKVPVVVDYSGLSSVTAKAGEVMCKATIGTFNRMLQVRFTVDGKPRLPPETLRPLPRAVRSFEKRQLWNEVK